MGIRCTLTVVGVADRLESGKPTIADGSTLEVTIPALCRPKHESVSDIGSHLFVAEEGARVVSCPV